MSNKPEDLAKTKRLITWKDADQNLCTIAAFILDRVNIIRGSNQTTSKAVDSSWPSEPGDGSADASAAWFSAGWSEGAANNPATYPLEFWEKDHLYSVLCWFSFQNMVRLRLRQARQEIADNLFGQGDALTSQKNASRNATKRPEGSKFKREPER